MQEVKLGILACDVLLMFGAAMKINFYCLEVEKWIREDPRFENDKTWSHRASIAMLFQRAPEFAMREGLLSELPSGTGRVCGYFSFPQSQQWH